MEDLGLAAESFDHSAGHWGFNCASKQEAPGCDYVENLLNTTVVWVVGAIGLRLGQILLCDSTFDANLHTTAYLSGCHTVVEVEQIWSDRRCETEHIGLYPKFRAGRFGVISCKLCSHSQAG